MITIGFQPAKDEFYPCLKSRSVNGKGEGCKGLRRCIRLSMKYDMSTCFPSKGDVTGNCCDTLG